MPPPNAPKLSGIAVKIISAYSYWHNITRHIPKMRRYSLGVKIDILFVDIIELVSLAQFSLKEKRTEIISKAITKNDVLKQMLYVLLELKGIEEQYFIALAPQLEEVGRMLYGWRNQAAKQTA